MKDWIRYIPHPHYGNWGGRRNTHDDWDVEPIDEMDTAFRKHDFALWSAVSDKHKEEADKELCEDLKKIDPNTLGIYGRLYRLGCLVAFRQ